MNTQTQDLEQIAKEALGFVPTNGVDRLSQRSKEGLQYGLEHGIFDQSAVDAAQIKFREYNAKEALGFVPTNGVDRLSQRSKEGLQYGLEHGIFDQSAVDAAQKRYEASHKK